MKPESVTIVLVGHCNEEALLQILLGTIVFRNNDQTGLLEPQLINIHLGMSEGTNCNPFKPTFKSKGKGLYTILFINEDLQISLDREGDSYTFLTGLNGHDSGSCGPLANGGLELSEVLDEIYGF